MMVMRTSTDNGHTWAKSQIIAPEHGKRHQVVSGTSMTPEGWMIQVCDAGPGSHDGAAIHISKDGGKTWYDPWDGAPMPDFKDGGKGTTIAGIHAGVVTLKNGNLLALGRGNSIDGENGKKMMPMSDTTFSISNLIEGGIYRIYVRTICTTNVYSSWSEPLTITTDCNLIGQLPYTELKLRLG